VVYDVVQTNASPRNESKRELMTQEAQASPASAKSQSSSRNLFSTLRMGDHEEAKKEEVVVPDEGKEGGDKKIDPDYLMNFWTRCGFDRARLKQLSVDITNEAISKAMYLIQLDGIRKRGRSAIVSSLKAWEERWSSLGLPIVEEKEAPRSSFDAEEEEVKWWADMRSLIRPTSRRQAVTRRQFHLGRRASSVDGGFRFLTMASISFLVLFICRIKRRWFENLATIGRAKKASHGYDYQDPEVYAKWLAPYLIVCYSSRPPQEAEDERVSIIRGIRSATTSILTVSYIARSCSCSLSSSGTNTVVTSITLASPGPP